MKRRCIGRGRILWCKKKKKYNNFSRIILKITIYMLRIYILCNGFILSSLQILLFIYFTTMEIYFSFFKLFNLLKLLVKFLLFSLFKIKNWKMLWKSLKEFYEFQYNDDVTIYSFIIYNYLSNYLLDCIIFG